MPNYYRELPENAKVVKTIDAKDAKTMIKFNLIALIIMVVSMLPFLILKGFSLKEIQPKELLIAAIVYIVGVISYIILHELTHGLVYKFMTKEKLTFGVTLSCAFCGVPNIYVSKKTALLAILAPFVIFTVIFIPIIILFPSNLINLAIILIFGTHTSGCIGDLYGTIILFKLRGKVIMNDTGPKQTFYKIEE